MGQTDWIDHPSPNAGERPAGAAIDTLILHYTGMQSAAAALARMCDADAAVSAHYMIEEDGTTCCLVAEERRAWHAGVSFWAGARDLNDRSVGIELVNPGHEFGYRRFPEPQMRALETLALGILERHPIPPHRVIGHSDVAPDRKSDPGELFDWRRLARAGIGMWPRDAIADATPDADEALRLLGRFGYEVSGSPESATAAIVAFQRHFRPSRIDGVIDGETVARLADLVAQLP